MFARTLRIARVAEAAGAEHAAGENAAADLLVPLAWLDSFAMRNFTNDALFDDTLPVADGRLEAGFRVPLPALEAAMQDWFRRKGWLRAGERVRVWDEAAGGSRRDSVDCSDCAS